MWRTFTLELCHLVPAARALRSSAMKKPIKLKLRRETLRQLSTVALERAAGGRGGLELSGDGCDGDGGGGTTGIAAPNGVDYPL